MLCAHMTTDEEEVEGEGETIPCMFCFTTGTLGTMRRIKGKMKTANKFSEFWAHNSCLDHASRKLNETDSELALRTIYSGLVRPLFPLFKRGGLWIRMCMDTIVDSRTCCCCCCCWFQNNQKCKSCGKKRASMGCVVKSCRKIYHYPCAVTSGGEMIEDVGFHCVDHLQDAYAGSSSDFLLLL